MENVSHTLCALALARAGLDRHGPYATAAVVLGANLPDIDVVVMLTHGHAGYLHHHRGLTHSVVGLAALSVVIGGGLRALSGARLGQAAPRLLHLWIAAAVGLASHLALDGLNTYGIRPWLPFSNQWYYGDVAFILDPWMWLLFGGGACLASPAALSRFRGADGPGGPPHNLAAMPGWIVFYSLALMFMLSTTRVPQSISRIVALVWGLLFGAVLLVRFKGWVPPAPETRRRFAWAGLALAAVYLAGLATLDRVADARARAAIEALGETVQTSTCHPSPARAWAFTAIVDDGEALHRVDVDLLRGTTEVGVAIPTNRHDPVLRRVAHTREYAAWRAFARHPFVARSDERAGELILGDGRYSFEATRQWCHVPLPDPAAGVD